jgi:hypothetical protein
MNGNKIYDDEFKKPFEEGGMYGHVDLPRLKAGKNGGAFWSAYAPCPSNGTDFSDENYAEGTLKLLKRYEKKWGLFQAKLLVPSGLSQVSHIGFTKVLFIQWSA